MAGAAGFLLDKDTSVIHQSDSEGVTPLHLAIEIGLTSIIEELISLGADLNQASNDGQTPLHTAIRLCNCTKRQVEMTEALNQIQQENDDILSPSEALIQYLINEGSKNGIKDNDGHFPAQYAKDECIKQMAFKRSFGEDADTSRDPPIPRSTETHRSIGNEGGILYLDSCDVTMAIPPGSFEPGSCHDVSISLITKDPPTIKEDEFLTGHGVEINIPSLIRHYSGNRPIIITLPHAASPMKANKEFADIIWKHTESISENQGRRGTFVKPSGTS
nr:transient receptor potential cation channel subfamily A member 1-like [Lytechinus pictus]